MPPAGRLGFFGLHRVIRLLLTPFALICCAQLHISPLGFGRVRLKYPGPRANSNMRGAAKLMGGKGRTAKSCHRASSATPQHPYHEDPCRLRDLRGALCRICALVTKRRDCTTLEPQIGKMHNTTGPVCARSNHTEKDQTSRSARCEAEWGPASTGISTPGRPRVGPRFGTADGCVGRQCSHDRSRAESPREAPDPTPRNWFRPGYGGGRSQEVAPPRGQAKGPRISR